LSDSPQLTSLLARVVAETITEQTDCAATIKPPNDIYLAGRKVAGILVEGRTEPGGRYVAVAGIGINVNQSADDFPEELRGSAGSLAMATGGKLNRAKVALRLLRNLEKGI
jgi:BirA family biotin operon repressor/biotin-[acetyl-CoA-carboxylase] ligase